MKVRLGSGAALMVFCLLGVMMAAPTQSSAFDGIDRHVVFVNYSSYVVWELYASNVNEDVWQEDVLHNDVIRPGGRTRVNIDDGTGHCLYDIKVVFEDGHSSVKAGVNVCELEIMRINN